MKLYIDTTATEYIEVALIDGKGGDIKRLRKSAFRKQSEYLLPLIDKLLSVAGIYPCDLDLIEVNNRGGSFMSLRIGVAVANALGFAWGVKVKPLAGRAINRKGMSIASAIYDRPPDIGKIK
jgi:tRNA A37 threonylcarbamoyladenosine modification protein TsaB